MARSGRAAEQRRRAGRPASRAAGRRGCVRVSSALNWTSLLRYSPGRHRGPTSRHGAKRADMLDVDLHHGASTDVGLVRKVNEDSYLVAPPVFVVADGMGGHSGGDVASQMVVEEFQRLAESATTRAAGPSSSPTPSPAHRRASSTTATPTAAMQPGWHAGTTAVVAVLVVDDGVTKWLLANLGDSRIYRIVERRARAGERRPLASSRSSSTPAASPPRRPRSTPSGTSSPARSAAPRGSDPDFFLLPLGSVERLAAVQRRHDRDDRRQGDRGDPRVRRRPPRRRRRAGRAPRWRPGVATTPRRWWSMWWDW